MSIWIFITLFVSSIIGSATSSSIVSNAVSWAKSLFAPDCAPIRYTAAYSKLLKAEAGLRSRHRQQSPPQQQLYHQDAELSEVDMGHCIRAMHTANTHPNDRIVGVRDEWGGTIYIGARFQLEGKGDTLVQKRLNVHRQLLQFWPSIVKQVGNYERVVYCGYGWGGSLSVLLGRKTIQETGQLAVVVTWDDPLVVTKEAIDSLPLINHIRFSSGLKVIHEECEQDIFGDAAELIHIPVKLIKGLKDPLTLPDDTNTALFIKDGHFGPVEAKSIAYHLGFIRAYQEVTGKVYAESRSTLGQSKAEETGVKVANWLNKELKLSVTCSIDKFQSLRHHFTISCQDTQGRVILLGRGKAVLSGKGKQVCEELIEHLQHHPANDAEKCMREVLRKHELLARIYPLKVCQNVHLDGGRLEVLIAPEQPFRDALTLHDHHLSMFVRRLDLKSTDPPRSCGPILHPIITAPPYPKLWEWVRAFFRRRHHNSHHLTSKKAEAEFEITQMLYNLDKEERHMHASHLAKCIDREKPVDCNNPYNQWLGKQCPRYCEQGGQFCREIVHCGHGKYLAVATPSLMGTLEDAVGKLPKHTEHVAYQIKNRLDSYGLLQYKDFYLMVLFEE